MAKPTGYLVDLRGLQFDESGENPTSWVHALSLGAFEHPVYGKVDITIDRVRRFAANIKSKVRGVDPNIDYGHNSAGEAAGWVKDAEPRSDGLWLLVEWTKEAAQKIRDKVYRYFSAEFVDEWKDPKSGNKYEDVVLGGGITNRPFLKDLIPINLSEAFASEEPTQGGKMDPKKLRELLGLPEDAPEEQVTTKLTERLSEGGPKDATQDTGKLPAQMSKELAELVESNPVVKELADQLAETQKILGVQGAALRLAEVTGQLTQLSETAAAKNRGIPPAVTDELKPLLAAAPKELADKFLGAVSKLADSGFVPLGENSTVHETENDGTATKKFTEAVDKLVKDEKLSYADAAARVANEQPQLFDEYQAESYAFRI